RELDPLGAAVVEERLDRRADRPTRVEDVVDEHNRLPFEREVEARGADDGLRMAWRATASHLHVVAIEGDVDGAERGSLAGALIDEPAQALRERDAARLDADERDAAEIRGALDDLVRDARERPAERLVVEDDRSRRLSHSTQRARGSAWVWACSLIRLLSGLTGPG